MEQWQRNDLDELESILFNVEGCISPNPTGFTIDSEDKAAWAAQKILHAQDRITSKKTIADEYKKRVDSWLVKTTKDDMASIEYLRSLLTPFVITSIRKLRKGKTLHCLGVNLSMRKKPDKAEIVDENTAIDYCENWLPDAVESKKTLSRVLIKKAIVDGVQIPGVELIPGGEDIYITSTLEDTPTADESTAA